MELEQEPDLDELASLRAQVSRLSEEVADRRAQALHLEAVVARLRQELHLAREANVVRQ